MLKIKVKKMILLASLGLVLSPLAHAGETPENNGSGTVKLVNEKLLKAVASGNTKLVGQLLKKGADVNASNKQGETLLYQAVTNENTSLAELLVSRGANVNAREKQGQTPLHNAASHGYISIVKLLLSKGADINAADEDKRTPLHVAVYFECKNTVQLLIEKGASINSRDIEGYSPLDDSNDDDIRNILLQHGGVEYFSGVVADINRIAQLVFKYTYNLNEISDDNLEIVCKDK